LTILENLYMIFRIYPFGDPSIKATQIDTQTTTDTILREGIRLVNVTEFLGELV